jgi:hypothetical protein
MTDGRHRPPESPDHRDGRLAGSARIRGATGNGSRRMLLAAAAVCLCAIATGVSLAAFSSPGGQAGQTAGASNGSLAATARSAQQTPPVASGITGFNVTSAGIAKTALQYPPGLKNQILRWTAGRGGSAWSAVTAQLGNAIQVGAMRLYSDLRLECVSLASSVQTARSAPPIPYEVMERSYAKVLAALSNTGRLPERDIRASRRRRGSAD